MAAEIVHEGAFGAFPLLDVVSTSGARGERELSGVDRECSNRFFVMSQLGQSFPSC